MADQERAWASFRTRVFVTSFDPTVWPLAFTAVTFQKYVPAADVPPDAVVVPSVSTGAASVPTLPLPAIEFSAPSRARPVVPAQAFAAPLHSRRGWPAEPSVPAFRFRCQTRPRPSPAAIRRPS